MKITQTDELIKHLFHIQTENSHHYINNYTENTYYKQGKYQILALS